MSKILLSKLKVFDIWMTKYKDRDDLDLHLAKKNLLLVLLSSFYEHTF